MTSPVDSRLNAKWNYLTSHRGFRCAPLTTLFRLIAWKLYCLLQIPATIKVWKKGPRMYLPPEWRGVAKIAFVFRQNYDAELTVFRKLLQPGHVVVDVGASYGVYTVTAAQIVGFTGKVVAVEPSCAAFRVLEKNVRLNGFDQVRLFRTALSDRSGRAPLHHHPDSSRNSLGRTAWELSSSEEVQTATLSACLHEAGVERLDFIKMDVEGAEELVLRGGKDLLESQRPIVLFEINRTAAKALDLPISGAWDLLKSVGYLFYTPEPSNNLRIIDNIPEEGNVLAIHRNSRIRLMPKGLLK